MAGFYEEEPVQVLEQQLSAEDFEDAFLLYDYSASPIRSPQVRAGLCVCGALLAGSLIPWYAARFATVYVPVACIVLFLALALFFIREQPRQHRHQARRLYQSSRLFGVPSVVSVYRDRLMLKNEYEALTEFWTDYAGCVENSAYYVLGGGISRQLLVLKKSDLEQRQEEALTLHFVNAFAGRYRRVKSQEKPK